MAEDKVSDAALRTGPDSSVQWRRDPGYFLVGSLLLFLFLAAAIAVSSPNIRALPHVIIVSGWAALLVVRVVRKCWERHLFENATIQIEPPRPNLGGILTVTLTLTPRRRFTLTSWSVTLVCAQAVTDDEYAEEEGISKVERVQYTGTELNPHEPFRFTDTLVVPTDAPPTALTSGFKVAWYLLYVDVELAASPVWGLNKPILLTILP